MKNVKSAYQFRLKSPQSIHLCFESNITNVLLGRVVKVANGRVLSGALPLNARDLSHCGQR